MSADAAASRASMSHAKIMVGDTQFREKGEELQNQLEHEPTVRQILNACSGVCPPPEIMERFSNKASCTAARQGPYKFDFKKLCQEDVVGACIESQDLANSLCKDSGYAVIFKDVSMLACQPSGEYLGFDFDDGQDI
eukprot:7001846-Ditylum_brightwellii.AAC.1